MKFTVKVLSIIVFLICIAGCTFASGGLNGKTDAINYKGRYIYGPEVNVFQPCNKKEQYWIIGTDTVLSTLTNKYEALTATPYQAVFVEFYGELAGKADDGFAADYDGLVSIDQLIDITTKQMDDCS